MRARALTALLALAGCASPQTFISGDLGRRDGGGGDLTQVDLAGADFAGADLAVPPDLSVAPDLAAVDLASAPDQARPPDLAKPPDLVMGCVAQTQPCDVVCQNCGANLKCSVGNTGAPACVQSGAVPVGSACGTAGVDDCVAGAICLVETQTLNLCDYFCRTDGDCQNGGKCVFGLNGTNPPLMVCSDPVKTCDPVAKTGCTAGAFFLVTPDGQTGCHPAGPSGECGSCTTDYDCKAGFACFQQTAVCLNGGCARLCHKGNNADCPNGETCQPVQYDQAGDTWASWGVCT
jgi:hypothetical protein